jgi:hypothetical protein
MSVAPDSLWNLPNHRRPRGLGRGSTGSAQDWVFAVEPARLQEQELVARPDPAAPRVHALVEPMRTVALHLFENSLVATRSNWRVEWP